MAEFTAPQRLILQNFKFRVKWDGKYVAGVSKVALKRTTEVVNTARAAILPVAANRQAVEFDAVTLEARRHHDLEFEQWANKVWHRTQGSARSIFEGLSQRHPDRDATKRGRWPRPKVYRCWFPEYRRCPTLTPTPTRWPSNIKLENEGWEQDVSVPSPPNPL